MEEIRVFFFFLEFKFYHVFFTYLSLLHTTAYKIKELSRLAIARVGKLGWKGNFDMGFEISNQV